MLYHDFLKEKLMDLMCSEFVDHNFDEIKSKKSFSIEIPNSIKFGDISTNIAMVFSKDLGMSSFELAGKICEKLKNNQNIIKLDIVGPGFINIFFKETFWFDQLKILINSLENYSYKIKKKKICIEFVSANPTGLMHIGHARGAVLGDTIASILEEIGHEVTREYYINDAGEQIKKLLKTLNYYRDKDSDKDIKFSDELYPGEYLKKLSEKVNKEINSNKSHSNEENLVNLIMLDVKRDLKNIKVEHHSFISEKVISSKKNVEILINLLEEKKLSYLGFQKKPMSIDDKNWVKKKQLLFKSKNFGDDMDRALLKPNGDLTYFMSDIIYHQNKIDRNFDILINIWGVDHSGYVKRLKNCMSELNKNKKFVFEIKLTSLVNLLEGKKTVKMSKRAGNYVTLRDVIDKVGVDVLRFMMISRNADKKIDFDFEIVKSKTKDNPVFYVQYAYARCMSLFKIYKKIFNSNFSNFDFKKRKISNLNLVEEKLIIKKLCNFFNVIISSANNQEPHRITNYLYDLAKDFHAYWGLGKIESSKKIIIEDNFEISQERMLLVMGISIIIKKGMNLLKINCPENM